MYLSKSLRFIVSSILFLCMSSGDIFAHEDITMHTLQSVLDYNMEAHIKSAVSFDVLPARITYDFPWYVYEKYGVLNARFIGNKVVLTEAKTNTVVDIQDVFRHYVHTLIKETSTDIDYVEKDGIAPLTPLLTPIGEGLQCQLSISIEKHDGHIVDLRSRFILPFERTPSDEEESKDNSLFVKACQEYATAFNVLNPYYLKLKENREEKEVLHEKERMLENKALTLEEQRRKMYWAKDHSEEMKSEFAELKERIEKNKEETQELREFIAKNKQELQRTKLKLAEALIKLERDSDKFFSLPQARTIVSHEQLDEKIKIIPYLMFYSRYNGTYNFSKRGLFDVLKVSSGSNDEIVAATEDFFQIPGKKIASPDSINQRITDISLNSRTWFVDTMRQFIQDSGKENGKVTRGVVLEAREQGHLRNDTVPSQIIDRVPKRITMHVTRETALIVAINDKDLSPQELLRTREIISLLCLLGFTIEPDEVDLLLEVPELYIITHMNAFDQLRFKDAVNHRMTLELDGLVTALGKELTPQKLSRYYSLNDYLAKARKLDNAKRYPRKRTDNGFINKDAVADESVQSDNGTSMSDEVRARRQAVIDTVKRREQRSNQGGRQKATPIISSDQSEKTTYQKENDAVQVPWTESNELKQNLSEKYTVDGHWKAMLMRLPFKVGEREQILLAAWELEMEVSAKQDHIKHPDLFAFKMVLRQAEDALPRTWFELFDKLVVSYRRNAKKDIEYDDISSVTNKLRFIYAHHVWFDRAAQLRIDKNPSLESLHVLFSDESLSPYPIFVTNGDELRSFIERFQPINQHIAWNIWKHLMTGVYARSELKRITLEGKGPDYIARYPHIEQALFAEVQKKEPDQKKTIEKLLSIELGDLDNNQRTMLEQANAIHVIKSA